MDLLKRVLGVVRRDSEKPKHPLVGTVWVCRSCGRQLGLHETSRLGTCAACGGVVRRVRR